MGSLPRQLELGINGRRLVVVHGAVTSINRFIFASDEEAIEEELAASGCDGVIAGRCVLPFTRLCRGRLWHNAGVVGMHGTPRVWFSVLAPSDDGDRAARARLRLRGEDAAARFTRG